jgi:carbon storage regulator
MLVLERKEGESIDIGDGVRVTIVRLKKGRVKVGITAPKEIPITRSEIEKVAK